MKIISMKQLRQKFTSMRKALDRGESFLLMYRSKPLAVIRPYEANKDIHLLVPEEEKPQLPTAKPLNKLPEPKNIAIEPRNIPQLPATNEKLLTAKTATTHTSKPLDKFKLKKVFA